MDQFEDPSTRVFRQNFLNHSHDHTGGNSTFENSNFLEEHDRYSDQVYNDNNKIQVIVRCRPLSQKEVAYSNFETIRVSDGKTVSLCDPLNEFENDYLRQNRLKDKMYTFDYAFDKDDSTMTVFDSAVKQLIPGVLSGFNATVFAYGATGAGKTFTMLGADQQPGIMPLTINELFESPHRSMDNDYVVKVSYLEVYNETLRDLLTREETTLDIREDPEKGILVAGITEMIASTLPEVMGLLKIGNKNRIMEPTGANLVSSRSHAVLQLSVDIRPKSRGVKEELIISKLSMIDLAGSERAANTNNKGQRMIEGANINKSLLALGNCIMMLAERNEKGVKYNHIPYRDSKLTRLLKDSLGGNCRTIMIANVSPSVISFEDTHNTLKYANKAKNIKTNAEKNILSKDQHMSKYSDIISNLKTENDKLKKLLHVQKKPVLENPVDNGIRKTENLVGDIKEHFEQEIQLRKQIFELELYQDQLKEEIQELTHNPDLGSEKDNQMRIEDLTSKQKNLLLQINELHRESDRIIPKRSIFANKIAAEPNKEMAAYLSSVFQQSEMQIENLELQHREKRAEIQMKSKDRQIMALQNQLARERSHKMGKDNSFQSLEVVNLPEIISHRPNYSKPNNLKLQDVETPVNFDRLIENTMDILSSGRKKVLFPKSNLSPAEKHLAKLNSKRLNYPSTNRSVHIQDLIGSKSASGKYYYNKRQFMADKHEPFDLDSAMRNLGTPINKNYVSSPEVKRIPRNSSPARSGFIKPTVHAAQKKVIKRSPKRLNQSASEESHISTASTVEQQMVEQQEKKILKAGILKDINKKRLVLPAIERAGKFYSPRNGLALRYGESPYVAKFNAKSTRGPERDKKLQRMLDALDATPRSKKGVSSTTRKKSVQQF